MEHLNHPQSIVESKKIGHGTRIWAFAHILPNATIGDDCNICDLTFIENDVMIGNRVTIKSGAHIWDGITIEDDVFIGPNVSFTNDPYPRSKRYPEQFCRTIVRKGASIGANATILPGLEIGQSAMVGAGAVVTRNVPPFAIVAGNPARIIGYESSIPSLSKKDAVQKGAGTLNQIGVGDVRLIELPLIQDLRGNLSFGQYKDQLPFEPKRYFLVFDVESSEIRGEHAHYTLEQFLVCVKGSCSIVVDDGKNRTEIRLDRPNLGLYIPPLVWGVQYKYTPDAALLVLASDIYKPEDYIRDYDTFLNRVK